MNYINAYYCSRCEVSGMLDTTKVCWSCGQTDELTHDNPFIVSGSSSREGMLTCPEPIASRNSLAQLVGRVAGA